MFKRLLFLIILVYPLATFADTFNRGLLWQISSKTGEQSYLFGTMHSDDERITRLPAEVRAAFDESESFTGEVMMDMKTILAMSQVMYFTDGRKLIDIIGEDRYQTCADYLSQYGIPEFMASIMKPWAVATTISLPKPQSGQFLDLMLFQDALNH